MHLPEQSNLLQELHSGLLRVVGPRSQKKHSYVHRVQAPAAISGSRSLVGSGEPCSAMVGLVSHRRRRCLIRSRSQARHSGVPRVLGSRPHKKHSNANRVLGPRPPLITFTHTPDSGSLGPIPFGFLGPGPPLSTFTHITSITNSGLQTPDPKVGV